MNNEQIAEKLAKFLDGAAPYLGDDYPVIEAAIARLRAPAALPEGWISVGDWLPIAGVEVLATGTNERGQTYFDLCKHHEDEGWLAFDFVADEHSVQTEAPTHWRYIAAPAPSGVSAPAAGVPADVPLRWALKQIADLDPRTGSIGTAVWMAKEALAAAPAPNAQPSELPPAQDGRETDLSKRLRQIFNSWHLPAQGFDPRFLLQAAEEIERYYGGMLAWKQTAETKDRQFREEMTARVNERIAARAQSDSAGDAIDFLKKLKGRLMHARRFGSDTLAAYRSTCTDAESEIEEFLIAASAAKGEQQ